MRILIVADKNGVGHVKPFGGLGNHQGEAFWIGSKKFTVSGDNRIKLGKKFMNEHGFTRSDGRKAIIIDTGFWQYRPDELYGDQMEQLGVQRINNVYCVRGARLETGKAFEPYYENENGSRVPMDVGTGDHVYGRLMSV